MASRDIVSWNVKIRSLASYGTMHQAEALFAIMPMRSTSSFNVMVTAYAQAGDLSNADVVFHAIPEPDTVSFNAMLRAYIQCGDRSAAWIFFSGAPLKDAVTWNIAVQGFDFRTMFRLMPCWNVNACNVVVMSYARERHLLQAWKTFADMEHRNESAWNCIIQAFVSNGCTQHAEEIFAKMPEHTTLCWNAIIVTNLQKGDLHRSGDMFAWMPHRDIVSWNAFLAAGKEESCASTTAKNTFDRMPMWSIASWNALISAYSNSGQDKNALRVFHLMQLFGILEEMETLAIVLGSCASLTALSQGKLVHACFTERHLILSSSNRSKQQHSRAMVSSGLVNMYGKCGRIDEALNVFEEMQGPNAVVWNAMIAAFALGGHFANAGVLFLEMVLNGIQPTPSTFSILLSMCSHAGLWSQGYTYFISMRSDFLLQASEDHFVCVVDLIARSGWLAEAQEILQYMPIETGDVAWLALVGACSSHSDDSILPDAQRLSLKINSTFQVLLPSPVIHSLHTVL